MRGPAAPVLPLLVAPAGPRRRRAL